MKNGKLTLQQTPNTQHLPNSFDEYLLGKAFVISLKRHSWRGLKCLEQLKNVGYKNIEIFEAVDGFKEDISEYENKLGLKFHPDVYPGAKGASSSMLLIYKKVVDENLPFVTIFEDDALPHPRLNEIGSTWYSKTDKTVDFLFLGSQFISKKFQGLHVVKEPSYCLHAYVITYDGAVKALELCKKSSVTIRPYRRAFPGVDILDLEVSYWMNKYFIHWQNWNNEGLIDYPFPVISDHKKNLQVNEDAIRGGREQGLIWQNLRSGTCIHGEEIIYAYI
jgi:GR25 family glycosyltransferase involved in LPS biosynthesis